MDIIKNGQIAMSMSTSGNFQIFDRRPDPEQEKKVSQAKRLQESAQKAMEEAIEGTPDLGKLGKEYADAMSKPLDTDTIPPKPAKKNRSEGIPQSPIEGISYDKRSGTWKVQKSIFNENFLIAGNLDHEDAKILNEAFNVELKKHLLGKKSKIKRVRPSGGKYLAFVNNDGIEAYVGTFPTEEEAKIASTREQRSISQGVVNLIMLRIQNIPKRDGEQLGFIGTGGNEDEDQL